MLILGNGIRPPNLGDGFWLKALKSIIAASTMLLYTKFNEQSQGSKLSSSTITLAK
jgi:hypothetical protein